MYVQWVFTYVGEFSVKTNLPEMNRTYLLVISDDVIPFSLSVNGVITCTAENMQINYNSDTSSLEFVGGSWYTAGLLLFTK